MLFNPQSELASVFSPESDRWISGLDNRDLARLIYVILSWREDLKAGFGFPGVVDHLIPATIADVRKLDRLKSLKRWHKDFSDGQLFHPFMSDVIGDTICADLLDYIARDRNRLGMELRLHSRLQRYFTIRNGTLYDGEGLRVSILVGRQQYGGQRRDVATAVMDVMRERYEMIERVYYHHKKAAVTSMLVKLVDLLPPDLRPRDDEEIYPAPWAAAQNSPALPPHLTHLSDDEFVHYAAHAVADDSPEACGTRLRLFNGLRYRRLGIYRTLLVIDYSTVNGSAHTLQYFMREMREGHPDANSGRRALERMLSTAIMQTTEMF